MDQEGGRVQRLPAPFLTLPPMRQLGQLDDPSLTERAAACVGAELRALGVNVNFAPVLDVDSTAQAAFDDVDREALERILRVMAGPDVVEGTT